jgi:predicted metal-binding membrane protein
MNRPARDRLVLWTGLAAVTATGWLMLGDRMAGLNGADAPSMSGMLMPLAPQTVIPGLAPTLAMWVVMMLAMMAPAAGPGVTTYLTLAHHRLQPHRVAPAAAGFFVGYLAAWCGFAALGALAQTALAHGALLSPMGAMVSPYLAAGILIGAGLYQWTPLKQVCVARCRSPFLQLMNGWRDGIGGAFRLGCSQGCWCVGCCWALMALMFVVGVMNLAWMAILSAFILIEKLVPARWHLDTAAGALLVLWGSWLLVPHLFAGMTMPA